MFLMSRTRIHSQIFCNGLCKTWATLLSVYEILHCLQTAKQAPSTYAVCRAGQPQSILASRQLADIDFEITDPDF